MYNLPKPLCHLQPVITTTMEKYWGFIYRCINLAATNSIADAMHFAPPLPKVPPDPPTVTATNATKLLLLMLLHYHLQH